MRVDKLTCNPVDLQVVVGFLEKEAVLPNCGVSTDPFVKGGTLVMLTSTGGCIVFAVPGYEVQR
jgi:hypothetical protein